MRQHEALTLLKMGKNVFLTGPAGSGKTYVLNQYIDFLKERGVEVALTASTGIAATHIGGMTIHSWAGIGIKDHLSQKDLDYLGEKPYLWKRFEKVKVLIIDEVSMLNDRTLDMVDMVCKTFKRNSEPFGGIQVVFSGDFFQLPPIEKAGSRPPAVQAALPVETISLDIDYGISYEYEAEVQESQTPFAFRARSWQMADLHICYLEEQYRQDDEALLSILKEIRSGEVSEYAREQLMERIVPGEVPETTKLYTHNTDVDKVNHKRLKQIKGEEREFMMIGTGKGNLVETIKRGCLSPEVLKLKIGALVMFVKNNPIQGYVNGTIGEVIDFDDGFPVVETKDGDRYVAQPQSWAIEEQGKTLAEISQVPLKLAWAVTIHKSQGMTLDSAVIDLSNAFVAGQGYVALSRLKSLDGLFLKGINRRALEVHPSILDFDRRLRKSSDTCCRRIEISGEERITECCTDFLQKIGGAKEPLPDSKNPNSKTSKDKKLQKAKEKLQKKNTYEITRDLVLQETPITQIALERHIAEKTIFDHIQKLLDEKMITTADLEYLKLNKEIDEPVFAKIKEAFEKLDTWKLKPVFEHFEEKHPYEVIQTARFFVDKEKITSYNTEI